MTPQRWQLIDRIFKSAIERTAAERAAFLVEACDSDELRAEVESLISAHEQTGSFLDAPAYEVAGGQFVDDATKIPIDERSLTLSGKRLGRYQVVSHLGSGGMGEVYLAEDRQLKRQVALKLLPAALTKNQAWLVRFEQEALAASSLNHPNIITIHEIGKAEGLNFIVTEFIKGQTLRELMANARMKLTVALDIAMQVASALAAAHASGIVHRDLKPENVMMRPDGLIKVLDFGLAKLTESPTSGVDQEATSVPKVDTEVGMVMGTAQYMSPEQARGLKVDARTDIFSLGVVLYEMLAGRAPFTGATTADVISVLLHKEPQALSTLAPDVPADLQHIISKAMRKDRDERYETIKSLLTDLKTFKQELDFAVRLERSTPADTKGPATKSRAQATAAHVGTENAETHAPAARPTSTLGPRSMGEIRKSYWLVAALLVFFATGLAVFWIVPRRASAPKVPFREMNISRVTTSGKTTHAAISHDGKYVAYVTADAAGDSVWVRHVGAPTSVRIAGPSAAEFFSVRFAKDGDSVYYVALDRNKGQSTLQRVQVLGGPSTVVANDVSPPDFSPDGKQMTFVRNDGENTRLVVANNDGSNERTLAVCQDPEYFRDFPIALAWSPDGRTIASQARLNDERGQYETVVCVSVEDGSQRSLTSRRWNYIGQPVWLADGSGVLVTAAESSTAPAQVWHVSLESGAATRITNDLNNYTDLSLTADSTRLAAVQINAVSSIWIASEGDAGSAKQIATDTGWIQEMAWTPEGRIVYRSNVGGTSDIWVMNQDGSNAKQLTTEARAKRGLAVSPDGRYIFFSSDRGGHFNIWRVDADGRNLKQLTNGFHEVYPQCARDGTWVIYQGGMAEPRLWKVPVDGGEAVQLTQTRAIRPSVSPNGELIAYHYLDPELERSQWSIGVVSTKGGSRLKRFDLPATVTEKFVRWSPDGASVAFPNTIDGVSDIWLQPLKGGPPEQLTHLKMEHIQAFEWSPDGRTLALIRGVETRDVVLIEKR